MDFQNLHGVWKLKRFSRSCIELIFKFLSQYVIFSASIFYYLDFQEGKIHFISFVFEILFTGNNSLTFIFLVMKFEVYKFSVFRREHFESNIYLHRDIKYTLTLSRY